IPPLSDPAHLVPVKDDLPEKIVRGEEHQVAAQIAVPPDQAELVGRHVLLVAGKHDQVVTPREQVGSGDVPEIQVREEIELLAGTEPARDRRGAIMEAEGNPVVDVRPADVDGAEGAVDVPAVAPAVALRVGKVVGLPGVGWQNNRDPTDPDGAGPDDEGRVTNPPIAGGDAYEVEATRPVTDPDADGTGAASMALPRERNGRGHRPRRGPAVGRSPPVAEGQDFHVESARRGRDRPGRPPP